LTLERVTVAETPPPPDAGPLDATPALADAGPAQAEPPDASPSVPFDVEYPPCRSTVWRGVETAVARWCKNPATTMPPYPYRWTAANTKLRGCSDVQRALASCDAHAYVFREDAGVFSVHVPFAPATFWLARLNQKPASFHLESFEVVQDCDGP
jgi:hypothetical protein